MKDFVFVCPTYIDQEPSLFARECEKVFGKKVHYIDVSHFSDGEVTLSFPDHEKVNGKNIILIRHFSFSSSYSLNHQLFNFLLVAKTLKECGAKKVITLMPYVPYARHDESTFSKGVGTVGGVIDLFKAAGVDSIVACDLHEPKIISQLSLPIQEIKLDDFWVDVIAGRIQDRSNLVIASPDAGGTNRASVIAKCLNVPSVMLEKERYAPDKTRALTLKGDVKGKDVVMVDDILDTAQTAVHAADMIMQNGARSVVGCFSHGVLSDGGIDRVEKSCFKDVLIANILRSDISSSKITLLSIADFIAKKMRVS